MFGINNYLLAGTAVVIILLSATTVTFYKLNQSKAIEIASLKDEQKRLSLVIDNKNAQIALQKADQDFREAELEANRKKLDKTAQELDLARQELENIPDFANEAPNSIKKLFENLKGRK